MPEPEHVSKVVGEWVVKAENDWLLAAHLAALQEDYAIEGMGFHAQQSAEKYLKALLVLHSIPVPKSHDLLALSRLIPADAKPDTTVEELQFLTTFAVDTRYPGPGPTQHREAVSAVAIARKIRAHVRTQLPEESLEGGRGS